VAVVHDGARFLLVRRAPHVLAGGAWCFVGGGVEPGETQEQALVREFHEEVGGRVSAVRKLWEYTRADRQLTLHWWLAERSDAVLSPNPQEVSEVRWLTPDEIESLPGVLESNLEFLRAVGRALLRPAAPRPGVVIP
jgi:8-oxo-dGTP pyrophosphatase MutT (NUDIX family)